MSDRSCVPDRWESAPRSAWIGAVLAVLTSIALSSAYSWKRAPVWDEGLFTDAALNFRDHGYLANTVLEPYGHLALTGVHRYTYWQFPLYLMTLGMWLKLVPATLEWIRFLSVLWQIVYLIAWFFFARSITLNERLALWVTAVVSLDFAVVQAASIARMEMMIAALGMTALACYTCLRDRNWTLSVMLAACCGAAAMCCHPMGALVNVVLIAMILCDWKKIQWSRVPLTLIPYFIAGGLCIWYAMQAPDIFRAQLQAAARYRVSSLPMALVNLYHDFYCRYSQYYGLALTGVYRLKAASLLFPVIGAIALVLDKQARAVPGAKRLLLLGALSYVLVAFIDNQHWGNYFVYSLPPLAACGVVWIWRVWSERRPNRYIAAALAASAILSTVGGYARKIQEDEYRNMYDPAVAVIRQYLPAGGIVMAGSEFAFSFGFGSPLVDDKYAGYYSGISPDMIVTGPTAVGDLQPGLDYAAEVRREKFRLVLQNKLYKVYAHNKIEAKR